MSTLHDNNNGLPAKEPRQWNMDTLPKAHMFQLVKVRFSFILLVYNPDVRF
jgi:hypothetical protein